MTLIENLIPTLTQFGGLLAVLIVVTGLHVVGSAVVRSGRIGEASIVSGWGIVISLFTVAGTIGLRQFTPLAVLIAVAVLAGIFLLNKEKGDLLYTPLIKISLLATPLLLIAAAMIPTQWDDLSQWLPNARFLFEHDSFPRPDLPKSPSYFPAYPYGLPIITYLASQITGHLVDTAGTIFNLVLYLCFGLFTLRVANTIRMKDSISTFKFEPGWAMCAVAALAVTILNPAWVTRLVFSSYSDPGTLVSMGLTTGLMWMALNSLSANDRDSANQFAFQAGLAACVLIGLRQSNLVLLLILFIGVAYILWRDPETGLQGIAGLTIRLMILPLIVWLAWRWQVETRIGGGEFSFRPFAQWIVADIPEVLAKMLSVAAKKGGYFGIMVITALISVRYLWRPQSSLHRLIVLSTILFLGYNAFLLVAYVGAFTEQDARRAASYWRYNTHLGGVCLLVMASAAALAWGKWREFRPPSKAIATILIVLVIAIPVLMSGKLRFDNHAGYIFIRDIARELHQRLSENDRLIQINQRSDGQYLVLMRYHLHGSAKPVGESTAWQDHDADGLRKLAEMNNATHIWVYENTRAVMAAFGVEIPKGFAVLLEKKSDHWQIVKKWPHPATDKN